MVFPTHDFYLYVDEFQDMANAVRFDEMFSQARNGRLSLTCLHQYQGQLSERVRTAVFGNIGTLIAFQVGADDAAHLERAMSGEIKAQELTGLGRFEIAAKVPPAPGRSGLPRRAITLPPTAERAGYRAAIIERARTHYGRPRAKPERAIAHFLASEREKRIAKLTHAMKQKPNFSTESPGAQFSARLSELKRKRAD